MLVTCGTALNILMEIAVHLTLLNPANVVNKCIYRIQKFLALVLINSLVFLYYVYNFISKTHYRDLKTEKMFKSAYIYLAVRKGLLSFPMF